MAKVTPVFKDGNRNICGNYRPILVISVVAKVLKTSKPSTFADDTNLTCIGQNSNETEIKLNEELENVHQWLTANKLTLNDEKTEFMLIGSRSRLASIDNRPILKLGYRHIRHVRYKNRLVWFLMSS